MRSKRMALQIIAIYIIIIGALTGSALFFFYLNTDAIMKTVETETTLSAALLSSGVITQDTAAENGQSAEALARRLDTLLPRILSEAEEDMDVWVVSRDGTVLFSRGSEFPEAYWQRGLEENVQTDLFWSGKRNPFRLDQELILMRRVPDSDLMLVMVNHCSKVSDTQRRQFALFAGIELVLLFTVIILLTNTIYAYRRQLIQLATTDELTGLANRKSFQNAYREFAGKLDTAPFSLFLADIDYFKQVNDSYGHAVGDQALQTLAAHIISMTEQHGGFAGRWGGDEFIGVLPLDGSAALDAVCRLCDSVRSARIDGDKTISISAGIAPSEGEVSLTRLSEKADRALYASKARGRDMATLYDPSLADAGTSAVKNRADVQTGDVSEMTAAVSGMAVQEKGPAAAGASGTSISFVKLIRIYLREKLLAGTLEGVRWMAPFVAGGGILIGLAFLFDALSVDLTALSVAERVNFGTITPVAAVLKTIGGDTFNFMLPVFAGFMAYSLAGKDAFLAGFVGGFMTIGSQSGFIGAMVAGFTAGLMAEQMKQFTSRLPALVQKAAPIMIYPVLSLLLMQAISWLVITPVSSAIGYWFRLLLDRTAAENSLLAGGLSGCMMAIDMGGIINKVAYNYAVAGLADGGSGLMASVMAGGMVPPIGIALSLLMFKTKYSTAEKDRFAGTLFMGLSFITEGALPFVFTDFLRVIPACMVGSGLAGLLSAAYGCKLPAPHGGVFVLPVIEHPLLFMLAITAGSFAAALVLGLIKKNKE